MNTKTVKLARRQVQSAYVAWLFAGNFYHWDEAALAFIDNITGETADEETVKRRFAAENYGEGATAQMALAWLGFPAEETA